MKAPLFGLWLSLSPYLSELEFSNSPVWNIEFDELVFINWKKHCFVHMISLFDVNKKRTLWKYFTFQLLSFQRGLVQTIYSGSNYIVHMYNLRHIICLLGTGVRISMEFKWVPTSFVSSEVLSSYTLLPYQVV